MMNANNTTIARLFFRPCVSVYALCATLALPAVAQQSGNPGDSGQAQDVKVSDYGTVDISVQDTDLATVLQMLSIESKKNIITSKGVSATVSANLYDVTFQEALKAILDVNGYTYYEEGNFIYVITKEEAVAMEKARRRSESRIFELNYLAAEDAFEFIQPLLSEDGRASARGTVQRGMKPDLTLSGADDYAFTPRLVVNDYPENLQAISALLTSLDTPPQQVLVEGAILQTALDEANAFGVDFTVLGSLNFTDLTNPLAAVNNLLGGAGRDAPLPADNSGGAVTSTVGDTRTGRAGLKVGIVSDDVSVFLRVLDEVIDTTVLARPKLMALNRQRAEVLVGTRVGYLSTTSTETTTTQNVQFLDTGIQLVFRPFIANDGTIRMELRPSVSDFRLRDVTDSTGNVVTIPDELTNQVTTNVRVKDGQTLVLGGLFTDRTQTTRRQVPMLGDIPIVGAAFRGQDDSVVRTEVIFLITPTIVHDETLWAMGEEHLGMVDSMRVGARAQLLPFSREKVTSNYNQKALEAYNKGDHEKALFYINNSLSMAPTQPEMIRLREQITGERAKSHERSLMERTFRKHMSPAPAAAEPQASIPATSAVAQTSSQTSPQSASEVTETSAQTSTSESVAASSEPVTTEPQIEPETAPTEFVEVTPTPAPELSQNSSADESSVDTQAPVTATTDATPSPDSSVSAANVTPESWMIHQQFLFNFFLALDMPELAADLGCDGDMVAAEFGRVPFVTFDEMNQYAGVSRTQSQE